MEPILSKFIKEGKLTPRSYQADMAKQVIEQGSSLVVLPTGLGKTIIALILIAKALEDKPNSKILMLAPTKPLVEQHLDSINKFTRNCNTQMITGTIKPNKRLEIIEDNNIIISTPQTINNDKKNINPTLFDLIIYDEAHRASGEYAYTKIASYFKPELNVGLTASPGTTKAKVREVMQNINATNLEIKSEGDTDVTKYVNKVDINWIKLSLTPELEQVNKLLHEFCENEARILRSFGIPLRKNFQYRDLIFNQKKIFEALKEKNPRPQMYQAISTITAIMKIEHAITLLETQGLSALKDYFDKLEDEIREKGTKAAKKIESSQSIQKAKYIVEGLSLADIEHPKVKKVEELILKELNKRKDSKIIVFNHYRNSVNFLEKELNKNPYINAKRFVGQASKGEDKGLSQKEQKKIIDDFKAGNYNVLIASSVAEEGLDLPSVDTVIFYEPVPSDIRSIQRRGRTGRFGKGTVYILITLGTRDEGIYWASEAKEKNMRKSIESLARKETLYDKINKATGNDETKPIEKPKVEKQKLITQIFQDSKKNVNSSVTIFIDKREFRSKTYEELKKKDIDFVEKQMDIGDYQVGEECIIERKTISDFISSIIDGRLFKQAIQMSVFKKPIFLIEGSLEYELSERAIRKEQIYGVLFSLMLEFKIPVFFAIDHFECSDIIYQLAKREQLKKSSPISLRKLKKVNNIPLQQQYIIEGLPAVGPKLAIRLLEKFKTPKRIFSLSKDQLLKVEGMGEKKAIKILKVIEEKYNSNDST